MNSHPESASVRNRLLSHLPPAALARLMPMLRAVPLNMRESLIVPGREIETVWFVESGFVSLVTTLAKGVQAEVGLIGREGLIGSPLINGVDNAFAEAFVQAKGTALRMEASAFRLAMAEDAGLRALLLRYNEAMAAQLTQTAACNGGHGLEQRFSRWLLMARDRLDSDDMRLTQEFLALMLCVYRPGVTVAANALQRAGVIRYARGHITILDRAGLEAIACDCYGAVRRRFTDLLGVEAELQRVRD